MFRTAFTALLLAGSLAASASIFAADKPAPAAKAAPHPDDVVCTYELRTGSHLKRKICNTRANREREAKDSREALENMRRGGGAGNKERGL